MAPGSKNDIKNNKDIGQPIEDDDNPVVSDKGNTVAISAIKSSDANIQKLLESFPVPVFIKDIDLKFIYCNSRYVQLLNLGSLSGVIGKTLAEITSEELTEKHGKADLEVLETGLLVSYEAGFIQDGDKLRIAGITKAPLNDEHGRPTGILGVVSEVSQSNALQIQKELISGQINQASNERIASLEKRNKQLLDQIVGNLRDQVDATRVENRYEIALVALKAGVWDWNPETNKLNWNERCFEIAGMEPGDITLKHLYSIIHPSDRERVKIMWSRITTNFGWFDLEFRILVNDRTRWVRKSGYYLKSEEDEPGQVSGVVVDITGEKEFQEKLLESRSLFQTVVDDQTELICRFNARKILSFCNKAFQKFFNLTEEAIGVSDLKSFFDPRDYIRLRRALKSLVEGKSVAGFNQKYSTGEKGFLRVQWTLRAFFDKESEISGYQFVGRDISEIELHREALRRSEEMFRLIAENSNDIISIHSMDGFVEYVSPSILGILGYQPQNVTGTDVADLIYFEDKPVMKQIGKQLNRYNKPILISFRIEDTNGNLIWFESMIQPQYDSKGLATGRIIAVTRNIHKRKLVEAQQKKIETELKEANLTKDKFFSIIAHDLRSPFTSILGFSRLLNDEYDDFDDKERKLMVQQILTSTESTYQLLDNLLAWGKSQMGNSSPSPEDFYIESLIRETIIQANAQAVSKQIELSFESNNSTMVFADINMCRVVLRNLISNAIKYSYPGSLVEIQLGVRDDFAEIEVKDSGVGIKSDILKTLFSLGNKGVSTKGTANERGTGLGLILVKEYAERNGGAISVESKPGEGSRFLFTLPLFNPKS
jgi:PAS domain S-box-containing protein